LEARGLSHESFTSTKLQKKEKTKLSFFVFIKSGILQIQKKNKKRKEKQL